MSVIEHQPCEMPSADSPGCEEYYIVQCDACGECWEVKSDADELTVNMHVCAECEKAEFEFRLSSILVLAERQKAVENKQ